MERTLTDLIATAMSLSELQPGVVAPIVYLGMSSMIGGGLTVGGRCITATLAAPNDVSTGLVCKATTECIMDQGSISPCEKRLCSDKVCPYILTGLPTS